MTKQQIERLLELSEICVSREAGEEKDALWKRFRTWQPDWEREELRDRLERELLNVYQERDRFRAALVKYGRHLASCDIGFGPCDCGLAEALKENQ